MSSKTFYAQSLKQAAKKAVKLARSNQRLIAKLELAEGATSKAGAAHGTPRLPLLVSS